MTVPTRARRGLAAMAVLSATLVACRDDHVASVAPAPAGRWMSAAVRCQVETGTRTATCGSAIVATGTSRGAATTAAARQLVLQGSGGAPRTRDAVVFGGQDQLVRLSVSDLRTNAAGDTTRISFAVRNLMNQAMGSLDGVTADANGVQVFVANGPLVTGAGSSGLVTVTDLPDSAAFPPFSGRLPYAQMPGLIFPGATERFLIGFSTPSTVTGFTFDLMLSTELPVVPAPSGGPQQLLQLAMSSNARHACVVARDPDPLASGDQAWCWGYGVGLGLANDTASVAPRPIGGYAFSQLDAYLHSRCGLTPEGLLYCWGDQNGFMPALSSSEPQPAMRGVRLRQFSMALSHVCGVAADSTAWCQGSNANGQLGNPSVTSSLITPVPVVGNLKWREVTAGRDHACGLAADSTAWCWGGGFLGALGNGAQADRTTPQPVSGGRKWKTLSAGRLFTCGITASDAVYCWGFNQQGQLGNGTTNVALVPDSTLMPSGATLLAAGGDYACAAAASQVLCWGQNTTDNIGVSHTVANPSLVPVATSASGRAFTQVAVTRGSTYAHTCAVESSTATTLCWGANDFGQLGNQDPSGSLPNAVTFFGGGVSASLGEGSSCVTQSRPVGRTLCVGTNEFGDLGRGVGQSGRSQPAAVTGAFTAAVGTDFTCVQTNFTYCWGVGDDGQLGTGFRTGSQSPAQVPGSFSYFGVTAGDLHACVLDGLLVRCWGNNQQGQLGSSIGLGGVSTVAVQVVDSIGGAPPGMGVIVAGPTHTCGLTFAGAAWCWGSNSAGELGIGAASASRAFASPVVGGLTFMSLSVGPLVTCGVTTTKDLYCWGSNAANQLGQPTGDASAPQIVPSRFKWKQVAVGTLHACALTDGGYAYCWGTNGSGELGIDASFPFTSSSTPARVLGEHQFTQIGAGRLITCGIEDRFDGGPWCWGSALHLGLGFTPLFGPQAIDVPVKRRQSPFGGP